MLLKINQNFIHVNHTLLKRNKSDIKYIVIHYVGALGDAKANAEYYGSTYVGASADFFVGHSGDIWQANDYYNYYSWHCGGGLQGTGGHKFFGICTNQNSIGIELCVRKRSTKTMNATDRDWYFEDATVASAALLVRQLMQELDVDIHHVIRHYDVNGKICPNPFVMDESKWGAFKKLIVGTAPVENPQPHGIPASKADFIEKVAKIATELWPDLQILPSVVIAQCCLETGYGLGSDAAELVERNNLLGMKSDLINSTWSTFSVWSGESFVKRTPEVYGGKTIYINDAFRVYKDYRNCIEDYMQFLRNVRNNSGYKYRQVVGMTDPEKVITAISRGGYATDPSYITKVMAIIRKENLTRFDPAGGGEAAVATEKKYYRVGTGWKAGKCTGQIGAYEKLVNAKNACAIAGYGKYKVYNPDGTAAWPAAGTTTAQKAVRWALAIAADNSHGYNNAKGKRLGNPDYACSSFVAGAWRAAGVDVAADAYTAKMKTDFTKHGFKDVSGEVDLRTGAGMKCGDVVLRPGVHVEMVTGAKHKLVGARGNATGGAENGKAGDQTGGEIAVIPWWDDGWTICLRYVEPAKKTTAAAKTTYVVQAGAYKVKANAEKMLASVKKVATDAYVVRDGDLYRIQAGAYTVKANATKRAEELKAAGISAIVKTK